MIEVLFSILLCSSSTSYPRAFNDLRAMLSKYTNSISVILSKVKSFCFVSRKMFFLSLMLILMGSMFTACRKNDVSLSNSNHEGTVVDDIVTFEKIKKSLDSTGWKTETVLPELSGEEKNRIISIFDHGIAINANHFSYVWIAAKGVKQRPFNGKQTEKQEEVKFKLIIPPQNKVRLILDPDGCRSVNMSTNSVEEGPSGGKVITLKLSVSPHTDLRVILLERALQANNPGKPSHYWYTGVVAPVIFKRTRKEGSG